MLMTLILLVILMILRCNKTINTSRNGIAKCLCITDCIFDFIAFIMMIISEWIILHKMNDLDHDRNYWSGRREYRSNGYFTNKEWAAAIISTSALEISIMCHSYCVSFLYQLIHLKTNLCYADYKEKNTKRIEYINNNSNGIATVTVINNTPNNNILTFIGYDKDGRPIYAGNNQYKTINVPVKNKTNVNQNNSANNISNTESSENNIE